MKLVVAFRHFANATKNCAECWVISITDQRVISIVRTRNESSPEPCDKKQNVETDIPASCGGQANYMKQVSFHWPPLEAPLLSLTLAFLFKKHF